jgi:hypothetical protein
MTVRASLLLLLSAAAFGAPGNAAAQCRLCDTPTTQIGDASDNPIELRIEASLDFNQLILLGAGEGTAQIRPDGSSQVSGVIGSISSRAMVGSATVRGEPGRLIRIDMPRSLALHSLSGGSVQVEEIVSDLPASIRLDSTGLLSFRFGGRVRISGDAEGDYRGDLPITAEYL